MDVYVYAYMGYVGVPGMRIWDIWSHVYAYMGYTYMRIWDIWESREALGGFQACVLVGLFCVLVGLFCVFCALAAQAPRADRYAMFGRALR